VVLVDDALTEPIQAALGFVHGNGGHRWGASGWTSPHRLPLLSRPCGQATTWTRQCFATRTKLEWTVPVVGLIAVV
jgi:hypothetical protein